MWGVKFEVPSLNRRIYPSTLQLITPTIQSPQLLNFELWTLSCVPQHLVHRRVAVENRADAVLARPKEPRLAKVLSRVDADGKPGAWTMKASFPDKTTIDIRFTVPAASLAVSKDGKQDSRNDKGEGK